MTTVELRLERVAHGGYVVGHADGKVLFVTGGLPGELVLADVTETGSRFDRAKVVRVLEPSAGRVGDDHLDIALGRVAALSHGNGG